MPGIVGIISDRPATDCERLVRSMLHSVDSEQFYASGTYSTPELRVYAAWVSYEGSFAGNQPFFDETRDIVLLFSGECFIDPEVQTALVRNGHRFAKNGADWLAHLYEEEGDRLFERLNGLFSGVIIDKRQRKVFLFNDRYGVERIYWHEADGDFYFASEAKALLRVLPQLRQFDSEAVAEFLAFGCTLGTRTLFRGINILPAGSQWSFGEGGCRKQNYFSSHSWESQPTLSEEAFDVAFEETFKRIVPRYCRSEPKAETGISLTGGLDSRLILACRPKTDDPLVCYTFSGPEGLTMDDRLAARVAAACALPHEVLRIGQEFFSDFARLADRTVYISEGACGPIGAHEIHFNEQARQLAPIRLTGNYGSELFRGISTFKPIHLSPDLFDREFGRSVNSLAEVMPFDNEHPITFTAFREIPWSLIGTLVAARSQLVVRTPYLDNEMVALAYQNPHPRNRSPRTALNIIRKSNTVLGDIGSDMGFRASDGRLTALVRYLVCRSTFKLDYAFNEGLPHWLSRLDPIFRRVGFGLGILGRHKYLHYRSWFRGELASYLRQAIGEAGNRLSPFWNSGFLKRMVEDHASGRKNYVREINAVLTLEAVERLLFRGFPSGVESDTIRSLRTHPRPRAEETAVGESGAKFAGQLASLSSKSINGINRHQVNHSERSKAVCGHGGAARSWMPTFLGIGSMRCGSTWLYEVLKLHPDIRMSDCKEMDFFFMPQMLQYNLGWYAAHFKPNNGSEPKPVRGEISPRYARLKAWQVNRIAELLPDLRIILTVRHPIDRVWSQTLYDFGRLQARDVRKVKSLEFLRQLERARNRFSSDYVRTIKIWSGAFGREALHVSLFDELRENPENYVNGVLKHIGAPAPWRLPAELTGRKVWATQTLIRQEREMPEVVRWYIADQLLEPTELLNDILEGRVSTWVEELRAIRGATRLSWRLMKEINRNILSIPEAVAYNAYHAILDVRLWRRWRQLQASYSANRN